MRLPIREMFSLMTLIHAEYVSSNMSDPEFTSYARTTLSLPHINRAHVHHFRRGLGIPTNHRQVGGRGNKEKL